jgi:hypothetical protein
LRGGDRRFCCGGGPIRCCGRCGCCGCCSRGRGGSRGCRGFRGGRSCRRRTVGLGLGRRRRPVLAACSGCGGLGPRGHDLAIVSLIGEEPCRQQGHTEERDQANPAKARVALSRRKPGRRRGGKNSTRITLLRCQGSHPCRWAVL